MSDEELLTKYREYKKKRMIIISIIALFFILIAGLILYFHFNNTSSTDLEEKPKEDVIVKDEEAPIIKLKIEELEVTKGDDINYIEYVESVEDKVDGDLIEELKYEEIDTSNVGEQSIVYSVSDKSGNTSQAVLKVIVKEQEAPEEPETPEENKSTESRKTPPKEESNNKNTGTTQQPQQQPKQEQPKQEEPPKQENNTSGKVVKYFLFSDGYTMLNVADACASELKKTNRTGMCSPIQDENGIYLGMKLETN